MTIRPVDLQTMIPKLPELQKVKSAENELQKNHLNINIHKEQQQNEKNTKQVIEAKKASGGRIERENRQKDKQSRQENKDKGKNTEEKEEQKKEIKGKVLTKIDIRI